MLYYPQLSTGTLAQFPLRKSLLKRTVVNDCLDGRTVKLADVLAGTVQWELNYAGLTEAEWNAMKTLFLAVEGRLQTFVFLDPTDNLLRLSETFSSSVWQKGSLLLITTGIADPLGTTRAVRIVNPSAVDLSISQAIIAAGWFQYCFSAYVRSAAPGTVTLTRRTADGNDARRESTGPLWRRIYSFGGIEGTADEIEFGITIPAGGTVELFGLQAEAQPQPSAYKRTDSQAGVYGATRFKDDALSPIAAGPNDYSLQVHLVSKTGS
jgi:hypothetical protein